MLEQINFVELFELSYILAVFLLIQVIKNYFPAANLWDKRLITLCVALCVAVVFILGHHYLGGSEDNESYAKRLFLSFLLTVGFYDYIYKLVVKFFYKKEFNEKIEDHG